MSKYLGVIGNRDYIKRGKGTDQEAKLHFWEYLDVQPDGWLTSLVYKRTELPPALPLIADCGAWSWKDQDVPTYNRQPVTAQLIYDAYLSSPLPDGAMVIAPDHMLIPAYGNLDERRDLNRQMAAEFIELAGNTRLIPMATVHGLTLDERMERARELVALGYRHLAIGGLAARAANKREWFTQIRAIRRTFPHIWLHVLGLSSPEYAAEWHRIGIDSFDGSAHFKAAFTGTWYWYDRFANMLSKHQARGERNPEAVIELECDCRACVRLRHEGIDTREFGSNENNMGRAAHNQNMLHRAIYAARHTPRVIGLVSCVGKKQDTPQPAAELYQSAWFKRARAYIEQEADQWFILSAEHGLLHPGTITAPYERTLNDMGRQTRREWGERVTAQLRATLKPGDRVVILAGEHYRTDVLPALQAAGHDVAVPLLGLGIGEQLAWFDSQADTKGTQLCFW